MPFRLMWTRSIAERGLVVPGSRPRGRRGRRHNRGWRSGSC